MTALERLKYDYEAWKGFAKASVIRDDLSKLLAVVEAAQDFHGCMFTSFEPHAVTSIMLSRADKLRAQADRIEARERSYWRLKKALAALTEDME